MLRIFDSIFHPLGKKMILGKIAIMQDKQLLKYQKQHIDGNEQRIWYFKDESKIKI